MPSTTLKPWQLGNRKQVHTALNRRFAGTVNRDEVSNNDEREEEEDQEEHTISSGHRRPARDH